MGEVIASCLYFTYSVLAIQKTVLVFLKRTRYGLPLKYQISAISAVIPPAPPKSKRGKESNTKIVCGVVNKCSTRGRNES